MSKIKVGYIGDSPFIFSGFGVVAKAILSRLDPEVFEIGALGTMFQHYPKPGQIEQIPAMTFYQPSCIHDLMGFKTAIDFVHHYDPDILFLIADPGTLRNRYSTMMLSGKMGSIPAVTYFPLENAPLNPHIIEQAKMTHSPVTYTKWGAGLLDSLGAEADWVWHGADHADFKQYDPSVRERIRKLIGWHDRFVIGMVGMNKRTNRQPTYIEIARILKDSGRDDALVYLHCQEQGEMFMGGWELGWLVTAYGVEDQVQLKPNQAEHKYIARPRTGTLEELLNRPLPKTREEEIENLGLLDFVTTLNMFDAYLDIASAHGFNLPACESARCGVPIAMTDDGFARSEIYGDCAMMMKPSAADYWHTGAVLPLVSPQRAVDTIIQLWDDATMRQVIGQKGKEKFDRISWDATASLFAGKMLQAHEYGLDLVG